MERWSGRVAMVTGAGSGIGAAIAKQLVLNGMKVVALDRVEVTGEDLKGASGKLYPLKCDVSNEADILDAFEWVKKNLEGVDVLVNNEGVYRFIKLSDFETSKWHDLFNTNVLGLSICTREALKSMQSRGVDDGHIVHINSVAGHYVTGYPGAGVYTASKFGVTALTEALRKELVALKSRIRVTSISPGMVKTGIFRAAGFDEEADPYNKCPYLIPEDIACAVVFALEAPVHVQIHELTIKPVGEMC